MSRVLVVGPSWVGDMVMAQSLFKVLRQRQPDRAIDVLAPGWSLPLLARMPEVEHGIEMPLGHGELGLGKRWRLGRELRASGYAQAILLPNSLKSALAPFWAGIPRRTGWLGEQRHGLLNDIRRLDKQRLTMTVQRFVALANDTADDPLPEIPPPALRIDPAETDAARAEFGIDAERPLLALCPGAEYGEAKRWPEAHYAALARDYLARGWQVALFGSLKDRLVSAAIASAAPGCIDLAGHTSLARAIDLLAASDAVVSNDSGLMHVAAALQRPLVAVYGSSDPAFTPPLNAEHRIAALGLDCSPCFQRECPLGHLDCLNKLPVARVADLLRELLAA